MNPKDINTTALAYIGDAVYEVYVRRHVLENSLNPEERVGYGAHVDALHKRAVRYVCAAGQATALKDIIRSGFLSDEETDLAKRARNHKSASKPKNADAMDYKYATAFEALMGYLYLEGRGERLEEIIFEAFELIETGE